MAVLDVRINLLFGVGYDMPPACRRNGRRFVSTQEACVLM